MKFIPLTRGYFAIVDDDKFEELSNLKWHVSIKRNKRPYASTSKKISGKVFSQEMHRMLMSAMPGQIVDHINGNPLDNRIANLRFATHSQNLANNPKSQGRKRYRGVFRYRNAKRWTAIICKDKRRYVIGVFDTEIEAANAYRNASISLYGDYSPYAKSP